MSNLMSKYELKYVLVKHLIQIISLDYYLIILLKKSMSNRDFSLLWKADAPIRWAVLCKISCGDIRTMWAAFLIDNILYFTN